MNSWYIDWRSKHDSVFSLQQLFLFKIKTAFPCCTIHMFQTIISEFDETKWQFAADVCLSHSAFDISWFYIILQYRTAFTRSRSNIIITAKSGNMFRLMLSGNVAKKSFDGLAIKFARNMTTVDSQPQVYRSPVRPGEFVGYVFEWERNMLMKLNFLFRESWCDHLW